MGTTTCALGIFPEGAVIAHVGDSRVYRLRGQSFEQLTFDHSLVWEMRASGDMSEEALQNNAIPKNVITRSLGPNPSVAVDLEGPFQLKNGDKFLLCSDGLSGQLTDEEMGVLLQVLELQMAVDTMVHLANLRGGPDNITVVVGEVNDESKLRTNDTPEKNTNYVEPTYPVAFGVVTAICFLTCVVMLLLGQIPIAALSAGAAVIAFATGWFKYQGMRVREVSSDQFGKAPYRKCNCKPDAAFASKLASVIEELNDWVRENDWKITLPSIEDHRSKATAANSAKNYSEAIRNYSQVISLTMTEVRRIQKEKPGDSNIDL
jgi:PPM family protein phosphatase